MLKVQSLSVSLDGKQILNDLSFELQPGQWLMLVGPNGAGKSTTVRAIAQRVPYQGEIRLNGQDVKSMKPDRRAREIGILSQYNSTEYAYTVEEVVQLGRYAYRGTFFNRQNDGDESEITRALEQTGLTQLRKKNILSLSGGERQRVFLAQVFAQNPRLLILDEPANHLDLKYQMRIFGLIDEWRKSPDRAVISVVHDISLARKYGTHALLMNLGQCYAQGDMESVFSPENLNRVYDMDVGDWMQSLLRQWI